MYHISIVHNITIVSIKSIAHVLHNSIEGVYSVCVVIVESSFNASLLRI